MKHEFCKKFYYEVLKDVKKVLHGNFYKAASKMVSVVELTSTSQNRCFEFALADDRFEVKSCCFYGARAEGWLKWLEKQEQLEKTSFDDAVQKIESIGARGRSTEVPVCMKLEQELENFLEDPMTVAMRASDCSDLVILNHKKSCPICNPEIKVVKKTTRVRNRFQRGSGVYKCAVCGRMTRSTGRGDNEYNGTCAECFDLAGIENGINDGHEVNEALIVEINNLYDAVIAKGGKPSFDFPEYLKKS